MELESPWRDSNSTDWLPALSLPTLTWARPFLPLMGLPDALLEHPEVWKSIYTQVASEHETRLRLRNWAVGMDGGYGELMRQVVTKAFQQLAEQMGREVAVDLERWVRFHFFCPEARSAMREWDVVLSYAYLPEDSRRGRRKVPPPAVMIPLLPEIWNLVNDECHREIREMLMRVAPPPSYEQVPGEKMEHDHEATLIARALNQALTLKALQGIAKRLNETEQKEVVAWAELQIQAMDSRHGYARTKKLCGDKYLQVELPCSNMPSVLDLPAPDESGFDGGNNSE